ncbi:MAG TPA: protein-L-isoaspartate(D-aspartate) O-methyltransferase [Terriglobales bacterium]|nr:protein-L-isoaspartate(D-aspartate) O-methyltransferase [Terriglobales bacterium]
MAPETQIDSFLTQRRSMVESQLRGRGIRDERVLAAMFRVPRHEFVSEEHRDQVYEDHPIPIGEGQTISQPYIVAIMLEALALNPSDTVLEIGTGSGYQTALLSELTRQVYSVERHEALARAARATLARLGFNNVEVFVGDGSRGLPDRAPFDAIVVSAAAPQIPPPLFEQLREGGRMVIPVGPAHAQELQLVRKHEGQPVVTSMEGCRFVPLIGSEGYRSGW